MTRLQQKVILMLIYIKQDAGFRYTAASGVENCPVCAANRVALAAFQSNEPPNGSKRTTSVLQG